MTDYVDVAAERAERRKRARDGAPSVTLTGQQRADMLVIPEGADPGAHARKFVADQRAAAEGRKSRMTPEQVEARKLERELSAAPEPGFGAPGVAVLPPTPRERQVPFPRRAGLSRFQPDPVWDRRRETAARQVITRARQCSDPTEAGEIIADLRMAARGVTVELAAQLQRWERVLRNVQRSANPNRP